MNDILAQTFMMATLLALVRNRLMASAILLGLASMLKQFAWIFIPFYLAYVYTNTGSHSALTRVKKLWVHTWPLFAIWAIVLGPFLIWDFSGLWNSLIVANAEIYPFRAGSLGFTNIIIVAGWIDSNRASFPIHVLYLLVVIPILVYALRKVFLDKSISSAVSGFAITLIVFLFCSKYFGHNYFPLCFSLMFTTLMWSQQEEEGVAEDPSK